VSRHLVVTGTGRAGTTFLVQLLGACGLDTGLDGSEALDPIANAGCEWHLVARDLPYVVKSPELCGHLGSFIADGHAIDHVLLAVRDIGDAAESRRRGTAAGGAAGGLWGTTDPAEQERVLETRLCAGIVEMADLGLPVTILAFPRMVRDVFYLWKRLRPLLLRERTEPGLADEFWRAFEALAKPELVHEWR